MSDEERIVELTAALADVISRKVAQIKDVTSSTRTLALNALIEATHVLLEEFSRTAGQQQRVCWNELSLTIGQLKSLFFIGRMLNLDAYRLSGPSYSFLWEIFRRFRK